MDYGMADYGPIRWLAVGSVGKRVLESYYTVAAVAVCCDDEVCYFGFYHTVDVDRHDWWVCGCWEYDFGRSCLHSYIVYVPS